MGTSYNFSTFLPEELRGAVKRTRRECRCRICSHHWESNHPVAMQAPEPAIVAKSLT